MMIILKDYTFIHFHPNRYHHTAMISLVYALREGLSAVAQEGIDNIVKRHQMNAKLFYAAMDELGLELFVKKEVENANKKHIAKNSPSKNVLRTTVCPV